MLLARLLFHYLDGNIFKTFDSTKMHLAALAGGAKALHIDAVAARKENEGKVTIEKWVT